MLMVFIFLVWLLLTLVMTPSLMDKVIEKMPAGLLALPTNTIYFTILGVGLLGSGAVIGKFVLNAEEINIQKQCCSTIQGTFAPISGDCTDPSPDAQEKYPTCIDRVSDLVECCNAIEGQFSLLSDQCVIQEDVENPSTNDEKSKKYAECSKSELTIMKAKPLPKDTPEAGTEKSVDTEGKSEKSEEPKGDADAADEKKSEEQPSVK